jgi:hypothetical protein
MVNALSRLNNLTELIITSWLDEPTNLHIVFPRSSFLKLRFRRDRADPDSLPIQFDLSEHQSLQSLDFAGMGSTSENSSRFLRSFFDSLRVNRTLENLDLEDVYMDENVAQMMFCALEDNQSLSKLNISIPQWEVSKIFEIIQRYFQSNCGRLEWLKINGFGGSIGNPVPFFETLAINRHLKFLWIYEVEHAKDITHDSLKKKLQSNGSLVQVLFRSRVWEEPFLQANRQSFLFEIKSSLFFKFRQLSTDLNMYREIFSFAGFNHQDK